MTAEDLPVGLLESSQQLAVARGEAWTQAQLLAAASASQLRNTGWPIGVVLDRDDLLPRPTQDGIEFTMPREGEPAWEDHWTFKRDGRYYVARVFEEDVDEPAFATSEGHPTRPLWFDVRIWRVAELFLHSATLYENLSVAPDAPFHIQISHLGLMDREFWHATGNRFVRRGKICRIPSVSWQRTVTTSQVRSELHSLVREVCGELFAVFAYTTISDDVVDAIVRDFLQRKV